MSKTPTANQSTGKGNPKYQISTSDMPFTGTADAYKDRCFTFLNVLCNDKDMKKAATYLAPDCVLIHADHPPVKGSKAFIEMWEKNLAGMPKYQKDIEDIIVETLPEDKGVARVWVYSQIAGIKEGAMTDSIDMMRFAPNGLFLESKDVQRTVSQF
jgi:hypothetical protein